MIECFAVVKAGSENTGSSKPEHSVALNFEQRQKSRARAVTNNGDDVSWFLPRAEILADGDCLQTKDNVQVRVIAADETLSEVCSDDTLLLTRVAYHLGNRHVPLQIKPGALSYQHDHVLDAMVEGLGIKVACVKKPFQPENGAYHEHSSHSHSHSHERKSSHEHKNSHELKNSHEH